MLFLNIFSAIVCFVMAGDYRRNGRPMRADFWLAVSVLNFIVVAIDIFMVAKA